MEPSPGAVYTGSETPPQQVVDLRRMLRNAGYGPEVEDIEAEDKEA
jgi:hypothetical protein